MKSNKKAEEIWNKIIMKNSFKELIRKYRKLAGIEGLTKQEVVKLCGKRNKRQYNISEQAGNFSLEALKFCPSYYAKEFRDAFFYYFLFDQIDAREDDFSAFNLTDCDSFYITDKNVKEVRKNLTEGIYIKIGPDASISDIHNFINQEKIWLRIIQDKIRKKIGFKKMPRIRVRTKRERDKDIYMLSRKSKKALLNMGGGNSNYIDIQIQNILEKNNIKVSNDNIRKIISQQRKLCK